MIFQHTTIASLPSRMVVVYRYFLIGLCLCVCQTQAASGALPQSVERRITILSASDNTPLPAATVRFRSLESKLRDSSIVKLTGPLGYLSVPFEGDVEIRVSCIGFVPQTDTLTGSQDVNIKLQAVDFTADEIVVTAQFMPTKRSESLYDVEIIRAEQIQAQGAVNLSQVLAQRAGMRITQDNILGSSLSIQGIGGRNVKIMIDGVPVIGRTNGNVDLSQINLNNAERIEIVDDPLSVSYGTDALGGVVNIITSQPSSQQWSAEGNTYYESVGHYNADGNLSFSAGDLSFSLIGGRNFFDGFSVVDTARAQQWRPKEQYFGELNGTWNLDRTRLRASSRYFNEFILNRGEPRAPYRETAFDDEYHTTRFTNGLFALHSFSSKQALDVTFSHSLYERRKNSFFKDLTTGGSQLTTNPSDQDTSAFNAFLIRAAFNDDALTDAISYQIGIDFNLEDVEGGRIEEGIQTIDDYAAFAGMRIQAFDDLQIQPGLRYAYNTRFDAPLLPSVNTRFNVRDNVVLRASWAEGFRAPSLRELYFFFVDINHNVRGNTELDAERSTHYQADLQWTFDSQQNALKLEPGLFYNSIRSQISLAQADGDLFSYVNIGTFRTIGADLGVSYKRSDLSADLIFTYLGRFNRLSEDDAVAEEVREYSFSPELSANVMYSLSEMFDLNLFYKYTGELPQFNLLGDGTVAEGSIEDFSMLDLSVVTRLFDNKLALTTGMRNVFDVVNINSNVVSGGAHVADGGSISVGTGRTVFVSMQVLAPFSGGVQ